MSQQGQGTNSVSQADPPMKRKRGRPRKDESPDMPVTPGSESVKKSKQSAGTSDSVADNMVGQVVSGVIEGSFDAGYLLNVKVADTDIHLRGVVFIPGRFTPITAANDVAPHAKMYKRKEIHIPVLNPQTKVHVSVPPSEQSNKQPVELKSHAPTFSDQVLPTKVQFGVTPDNLSAPLMVPLAYNLPKNDTGLSMGGNVIPQQSLGSRLESKSAIVMPQLKHDKVVEQDEVLPESEASKLIKGPNIDVGAAKELKSEVAFEPSADMLPGIETVNEEPQIQHQALGSDLKQHQPFGPDLKQHHPFGPDLKHNVLVCDEGRRTNLEINQTPVVSEPKSVTSESVSKSMDIVMEEGASPTKDTPQDTVSGFAIKILSGDDNSRMNGGLVSDAANVTGTGSESAPMSSQPILMFHGEAIPSEPKFAAEGSILPGMIELNQTPIFAEPKSFSSEPVREPIDFLMEEKVSPKKGTPLDTQLVFANNILSGDDTSHLDGRPVSNAANIFEAGLPETSERLTMFAGEAICSEPKLAAEGSVLPEMIEHQTYSSSEAVNDVDCDIKEVIPPTQF